MVDLDPLKRLIYHEKQESGSMLCAQHALNALLQGNYFTASDLSAIAVKVDALERSLQTENRSTRSSNMDDTGFFSVQVINEALQVWGLRMVHWRSDEMVEFQDKPYAQFAFILNLEQHWFALRRFGVPEVVEQATTKEAEHCHWFNLNSFLEWPEWIGRIYLNMMLKQAEEEGYSVYAVARIDPESPFPLGYSAADEVAATLPQPTSSLRGDNPLSTTRIKEPKFNPGDSQMRTDASALVTLEGFEDEDMELQAALQASITGVDVSPTRFASRGGPSTRSSNQPSLHHAVPEADRAGDDDPVASSLARSKAIMERMLREQQTAFRENYEDEARGFESGNRWSAPERPSASHRSQAQATMKRTRADEEEEEELRRAIEASKVGLSPQNVESDEEELDFETPPLSLSRPPSRPTHDQNKGISGRFADHTGVYDDDDEALQAALKASLEDTPGGSIIPEEKPKVAIRAHRTTEPQPKPESVVSRTMVKAMDVDAEEEEEEDVEEEEAKDGKGKGREVEKASEGEAVDKDEMRRRRLARFGGGG